MRVKPGQHLSQAGVDLARRVGETMGMFQRAITSTIPRAYETAIAMGYAVTEQDERLSMMPDEVEVVDGEVIWDDGFSAFATAIHGGGATSRYAAMLGAFLASVAKALSENGSVLLVTHGGIVEAGAVYCLPDADHAAWGGYIDYCEGVRLCYEHGGFVGAEILRLA
jgi:broad specificity phosphatase PhoE